MDPLDAKTLGDFAKYVRERLEMNQTKWSKKIGYSQAMISQVEANKYQAPYMYMKSLMPYLSKAEINHMRWLLYREVDFNLGL